MHTVKILIVDDEAPIRDMLRMALELSDFDCIEAEDSMQAYRLVVDEKPDLMLLDWMLPGGSGIELLRRLRKESIGENLPVIMVTARHEEEQKIKGLEVGADDYVTKPFAPKELIARINAVLRRCGILTQDTVLSAGELKVDIGSHRVFINDYDVDMGPTEFKLLSFFMSHPDRAYSRGQLLDHVWGGNVYIEERTVDVHIRRLRKALQSVESSRVDYGSFIQTVRGTGYRFSVAVN